jgi:hypothetical protein
MRDLAAATASRWIVPNRAHLARSVYVNRVGAGGCLREMKELALRRNYWVIGLRLKFDVKNLVNQSYVKNIIIDLASQIWEIGKFYYKTKQ